MTSPTNSQMTSLVTRCLAVTYLLLITSISYVTSFRLRRLCKESDIHIMTKKGVRIEPYERSRVELYLANIKDSQNARKRNKFTMHFDFRTQSENGTLFYGRSEENPSELIAVVLRNGHLVYKVQCPNLHAAIYLSTKDGMKVNDNKWHTFHYSTRFGRRGQKGNIMVDGHAHHKLYDVNCEQITSLVFGGHSPEDSQNSYYPEIMLHKSGGDNGRRNIMFKHNYRWLSGMNGHYEGCIRRLNVSVYLKTPPKYYAVSGCSKRRS